MRKHPFRILKHPINPSSRAPSTLAPAIRSLCGGGGAAVEAGAHARALKLGGAAAAAPRVRNALLNSYVRRGALDLAQKLFDEMPVRAPADWNSILSGYWKLGRKEKALELFDAMPVRNLISWTIMVTGFSRFGEVEEARKVFDAMPERNVVSWNAMLSGYAQNGVIEQALESVLGALLKRQLHVNCFVKTALIDMFANCGSLESGRKVFAEMGDPNLASCNAMIAAYMREGDVTAAREIFDGMKVKDVISWNSMISGYTQNGQWSVAIELFKEMVSVEGLRPDEITISSVLSACGHLGILHFGKWVVDYAKENKTRLSISGYNALIFMYSRCGVIEDAKRVFDEMTKRDVFSYNSMISGLAANGNGLEAIELMRAMEEECIEPDSVTYLGVLTACSHGGLPEEGRRVFNAIENPNVDHYACKVDLLCRAGRLDEARKVVDEMPMKPHAGLYGALLNAGRKYRNVNLGEFAAKELFKLEPENSGNYVLLSNIYASLGRWKDVDNIRRNMIARGVNKMVGCSWVEFNHVVHRFVVGDRSHHLSEEIYKVLQKLERKIRAMGYIPDKSCVLKDVDAEEKEEMVGTHSEKLTVAFGLLVFDTGQVIRVVKNLRICDDCHTFIKMISKIEGREIVVRDNNRFHQFSDGSCSCKDYW
ncbi:Pentatricopeptide repeat-containing protein [Ananas comosus]|uniref:Pentatricopeptide repeat-containing protein n=1 Tax=Ananas comosus TaxID=4615 RepID=A0A199UJB6_ANACO|nr:Pentatricopeptide repeat-containing protein [Ananas comosus]